MNFILPDWIDGAAWAGWVEAREELKRIAKVPFTQRAKIIALCKLTAWHEQGYDVNAILDEAVYKGWRGLWVNEQTPRIAKPMPVLFEPLSPKLQTIRDRVEQHEREYWAKKNAERRH